MTTDEPTTKVCPFCAETIQAAAIVCRYCGRDLVPATTAPSVAEPVAAPHLIEDRAAYSCSVCGGYLRANATECKHCKAVFTGPKEVKRPPATTQPLLVVLAIFGALVVGALGLTYLSATGGSAPRGSQAVPPNAQLMTIDARDPASGTLISVNVWKDYEDRAAGIAGQAQNGDKVLLIRRSGDGALIRLSNGTEGWVNAQFIQELR